MSLNLFTQSGEGWRQMRTKLTPAFTLGKLKGMFETFISCGESMLIRLKELESTQTEFDAIDVFSRFTANVTTSVGFGLDSDCFKNNDKTIIHYARSFNTPRFKNVIRLYLSYFSPFLAKLFGIRLTDKDVEDFMQDTSIHHFDSRRLDQLLNRFAFNILVSQNVEYREKNNIVRRDFFQLMMQLRNTGKVYEDNEKSDENNDDVWDATPIDSGTKSLSLNDMAAQSYIFFIAGYESSSTTMVGN